MCKSTWCYFSQVIYELFGSISCTRPELLARPSPSAAVARNTFRYRSIFSQLSMIPLQSIIHDLFAKKNCKRSRNRFSNSIACQNCAFANVMFHYNGSTIMILTITEYTISYSYFICYLCTVHHYLRNVHDNLFLCESFAGTHDTL